jgi:thiamine biosynthesis lipoprotein
MSRVVTRMAFPAMSTTMAVIGVEVPEHEVARAATLGGRLAADWERRFSRFRPDSLLSRLNAAAGRPLRIDGVFLAVLDVARAAVRRTGGRFDPAILPALEAAGYAQTIERVRATPLASAGEPRPSAGPARWDLVRIDRERAEVTLPPGMRIDLGGVAKGAFADDLAARLQHWPGGCVDAGGDLRLWGAPPDGEHWLIGIEDPFHTERDRFAVEVTAASFGVATSGTYRRRWQLEHGSAHHLIDPRRGVPAADVVRSVTAFAPDTATADVAAKALFLAAAEEDVGDTFGATFAAALFADGQATIWSKDDSDVFARSGIAPILLTV